MSLQYVDFSVIVDLHITQRLKVIEDHFSRQLYISDVSLYSSEMFIFLDETGADRRNAIRKYGYSMRGMPLKSHHFLARGERVSAIACISLAGLIDVMTVKGTTDGDTFYNFNGINPHSVVIMDNCAIHNVDGVVKSILDVGALVHFLPPYSPDLQPIEETFSKVKTELSEIENTMNTADIELLLLASFLSITPQDCQHHSGIY